MVKPEEGTDSVGELERAVSVDEHPEHAGVGVMTLLNRKVEQFRERPALSQRRNGAWSTMRYGELRDSVERVSSWLLSCGVRPGMRIAILADAGPEWGTAFFAALRSGAVVVPLDSRLETGELEKLLHDSQPVVLFVSQSVRDRFAEPRLAAASIEQVVTLDDGRSLDALHAEWRQEVRRTADDVALIVYTSGSTNAPKGVTITFRNLLFQADALRERMQPQPGDRVLSILPLNHLLELTAGFLGVLWSGGEVCYASSLMPSEIMQCLKERPADRMLVVPLFLRLLHREIVAGIRRGTAMQRIQFHFARVVAPLLSGKVRRAMFQAIHLTFGGRLRHFICGGAPLPADVETFFARIGMPVYQGYGMTEASPVITMNSPQAWRAGSVGKALPGTEVAIQPNGEIRVRGPHVMAGYYHRPDLTAIAIDADGWLHTGDVGRFDRDGFLYVTGRASDMIVLGNGKKVWPEEVEAALDNCSLIGKACVAGARMKGAGARDGFEEVCAVIVPAQESVEESALRAAALEACASLAGYKRPTRILVSHQPLPQTATAKNKRRLVRERIERGEYDR